VEQVRSAKAALGATERKGFVHPTLYPDRSSKIRANGVEVENRQAARISAAASVFVKA